MLRPFSAHTRLKGIGNMADAGILVFTEYANHIKTHFEIEIVLLKIMPGRPHEFLLFVVADKGFRLAPGI